MADRPILFSGPMVRALLEGRKTQTRRVLKPQPDADAFLRFTAIIEREAIFRNDHTGLRQDIRLPYAIGDRLYVRETWAKLPPFAEGHAATILHRADWPSPAKNPQATQPARWRPSIHMPRWASRLTLIVTDVRVERVQDISDDDAKAEGLKPSSCRGLRTISARETFHTLWNSLNKKRGYGWDVNPWIVALTFDVHQQNIDDMEN